MRQNHKVNWISLDIFVLITIGLLWSTVRMPSGVGREIAELGVVVLMFGGMSVWLWANAAGIEESSYEKSRQF